MHFSNNKTIFIRKLLKYVLFLALLPLITTLAKSRDGDAVRVNDRFKVVDAAFCNASLGEDKA